MLRCFACLILVATLAAAPTVNDFDARVIRFHRRWDRWVREYWGCSNDARDRRECNPTLSRVTAPGVHAACVEAREVFKLEGKCD